MPEAQTTAPVAEAPVSASVETPTTTETTQTTQTEKPSQTSKSESPARAETLKVARSSAGRFVSRSAEDPTIASKTRERLARFAELDDEKETPAAAPAEKQPDASAAKTDPATPTPAKEAAPAVETPAEPTLPAAQVRSLKALGFSDEQIAATPPAIAEVLHARRNQEITRWAEAGRKQQAAQPPAPAAAPPTPPAAQPTPPVAPPTAPAAQVADIAALKATYGENEPLIQKLAAQEQELAQFRQFRQTWEQQQEQAKLASLIRDVDQFFSDKDMAPYHEVYGKATAALTPEQDAKRTEVLKLADSIIRGAAAYGENLNVHQALRHAFDSVAAPLVKQAARQEITKELQQRSAGKTLKPGGRQPQGPPSRSELQARVKGKLNEMFCD